jgi:4-amino-4-deoxy-L-arabinose transferase-like glycosyltransferase
MKADTPDRGLPVVRVRGDERPRRAEIGVVALITAAFVAILSMWALLTPIYGAPDEQAHFNSAVRLAEGGDWPAPGEARMIGAVREGRLQVDVPAAQRSTIAELMAAYPGTTEHVDHMTQHPPLYYAFAGAVLRAIDYQDLRIDHAMVGVRLAGIIFMAPLPFLVWDAVRRLTRSSKAAVVGAAALLGVPQLAHITSAITGDGLVILLSAVVAWLAIRVMTGERRLWAPIALGAALGTALLTKGTALPLIPFTLAVLLWWPRDVSIARRMGRAALAGGVAFAIGGWWWLRNLVLYRDLQPSGLAGGRPTVPWEEGTGPDIVYFLSLMWDRVTQSFWGAFGRLEFILPEPITDVLTVLAIAVIVAYFAVRNPRDERARMAFLASLPLLLTAMLIANTWRHYVRTQMPGGLQGRYFFVVILVLIALSAVAWYRLIPPSRRSALGVAMLGVFGLLAVLGPLREYIGVYENSLYRFTREGLRDFALHASAGVAVTAVVAATAGILLAAAVTAAIRYALRSPRDPGGAPPVSVRTRDTTSRVEPPPSPAKGSPGVE